MSARGRIESIHPDADRVVVELAVWTEVDGGDPLAPGTAIVSLPNQSTSVR